MSRFKNKIIHLQAHIKTLRLGADALVTTTLNCLPSSNATDVGLNV